MSTPTTSLAPLSAIKALQAAAAMHVWLKEYRAEEREKSIATIMAGHRIKTGWFSSRPCTREEAEALVDRPNASVTWEDQWSDETWWQIAVGGNEKLAKRMEAAARHSADGTIWLNLEDYQIVASFLPDAD